MRWCQKSFVKEKVDCLIFSFGLLFEEIKTKEEKEDSFFLRRLHLIMLMLIFHWGLIVLWLPGKDIESSEDPRRKKEEFI